MLKNFLDLKKPIETVINISESKAFKSKDLFLSQNEYKYLEDCLIILKIFVLATTKLQGNKYPTIYYTIPFVYQLFQQLELLQKTFKVSIYSYF
jgi:hypothetical protein